MADENLTVGITPSCGRPCTPPTNPMRRPAVGAAPVRRSRRPEARPLVDLSDFHPAELSDFRPALTPFVVLGGGTCVNGGWLPPGMVIPDVSATGTVRFYALEGGFWAIHADDGTIYDPSAGLAPAFQTDGLRVSFTGKLRPDLIGIHMVGPIVEII